MSLIFKAFLFSFSIMGPISFVAAQKILFIGDSLTAGYGVDQEQAFPALIEKELKKTKSNIQVINAGVSGSLSSSGLSRLSWHLKGSKPDLLVLALGANDALKVTEVDVIKKNLSEVIEFALSKQIKVILAGMKVFKNYGSEYSKKFESVYTDLAKKYPSIVLYPFLLEGLALNKKLILPDGLHPTAEGHVIIAEKLLVVIRGVL